MSSLKRYICYFHKIKTQKFLKAIVIIIVCVCFCAQLYFFNNSINKLEIISHKTAEQNISSEFFIDTIGCRMPYFPIMNEHIKTFMKEAFAVRCKKALTRTSDTDPKILFNMDELEMKLSYNFKHLRKVRCHYREFERKGDDDFQHKRRVPFKLVLNSSVPIPPGIEFIEVECTNGFKIFYKDYHFFIKHKTNETDFVSSTEKQKLKKFTTKNTKPNSRTKPEERLSVMLLGIDSVSHLNFLRQLRSSFNYIRKNLTHVEFWGYNKVGDNTYPNLIPVLAGLNESELNISCLEPVKHAYFDRCAFIWKNFKKAGYQTVFAEDVANLGLFNYFKPGFKKQPTDYYLRPILLKMEQNIAATRKGNLYHCMGGRRTSDIIFEFIRKLTPYLKERKFFSFIWSTAMTHDFFNIPKFFDLDLTNIFQLFEEGGVFNKTVIFFMSDHGLRFGSFRKTYQGMIEGRQPLLITLYPKWLRQKYAMAIKNLELNARRLTTPFDLHATMLDLLDLRNIEDDMLKTRAANIAEVETLPRGISLFLPIPATRTCDMAGIASHWCLCYQREEMATNDTRAQSAANHVVKFINIQIEAYPQCHSLYLDTVTLAMISVPTYKFVDNPRDGVIVDITVRLQTKPGLGLFESTVRFSKKTLEVIGTISRINTYANQSFCVDESDLKKFCFC